MSDLSAILVGLFALTAALFLLDLLAASLFRLGKSKLWKDAAPDEVAECYSFAIIIAVTVGGALVASWSIGQGLLHLLGAE